ncbi:hypothetical protein RhiirA4_503110 [Rhizophagus irregularis]|uniref:Uncharacterized protein n=1 Tax=Rhizophagus irregularis TaxID=588596 RepID=A0A2I1H801_9GLOM|nr:hypothetical protein RhiirA4_503110 [Rhizophagus irregularis]
MVIIEEIGNYPEDDTIIYKQRNEKGIVNRSFTYKIITVGKYPDKKILQVTRAPNCYPIPDDYKIQTKWGRGNENKKFSESNAKTSGILLFGLQLNKLKEYRETKSVKPHTKILKLVNEMTTSGLTKRATKISSKVSEQFSEIANNYYLSEDIPLLESIEFSVKDKRYDIYYGKENQVLKHKKEVAIVRAMDKSRISRDGYRYLTAIEPSLPKENAISEQKVFINNLMEQNVKIKIINIEATAAVDPDEVPHIMDENIVETVINSVGKAGVRSIKEILIFLIPSLVRKNILNSSQPIISIRISGDGRNVGRKVKHVMITFAILNHKKVLFSPEYHYTLILYPGSEEYNTLDTTTRLELWQLKNQGLTIGNVHWKFELYFSSDWKFLITCLGFNSPTSNYFCPWCLIKKNQHSDLDANWTISKNMNNLRNNYTFYSGHHKKPLFDMIEIENYLVDELHVMLRITDRLWSLVIHEVIESGFFDIAREVIIKEMQRIGVRFQFWQERDSNKWSYTSLMGQEKLKVIRKLWDDFNDLYSALKNEYTDPVEFQSAAKAWLNYFLTPSIGNPEDSDFIKGLYRPVDITPYMHVLVWHIWEFMEKHNKWGIKSFSCSPVEKKNHMQVSFFFRKTMKDGGKLVNSKAAIVEILEEENRSLYELSDNISFICDRPQKIRIINKKIKPNRVQI